MRSKQEAESRGYEELIVDQSGREVTITRLVGENRSAAEESIIREAPLILYINGQQLVTLMCTPNKETYLVAGFLFLEGIISRPEDVLFMRVCIEEGVADVRLAMEWKADSASRILTSGCGGGTTFVAPADLQPVESNLRLNAGQITKSMTLLMQGAVVHRETGGVHATALGDGDNLLVLAEDVGRHNTVDKIAGHCFLLGVPTEDRVILTTGRISSEMLAKVAKMRVPIVVSHSSPTDLAVKLARDLNITLVGYARGKSCNIYTHDWRIS